MLGQLPNSGMSEEGARPLREIEAEYVALLPAEPKQGQMIEVGICDIHQAPEDWRFIGKGVATEEFG